MRINSKTLIVVLLSVLALTALAFGAYKVRNGNKSQQAKKKVTPCDKATEVVAAQITDLRASVKRHQGELRKLGVNSEMATQNIEEWAQLAEQEKEKAWEQAKETARDVALDKVKKMLQTVGRIGPVKAQDIIKKYGIKSQKAQDLLFQLGLHNVYKDPTWASRATQAIDFYSSITEVKKAEEWDDYSQIVFTVLPYHLAKAAKNAPKLDKTLGINESMEFIEDSGTYLSLLRSIAASGNSIQASILSIKQVSFLSQLNSESLKGLKGVGDLLEADVQKLNLAKQTFAVLSKCDSVPSGWFLCECPDKHKTLVVID